MLAAAAAIAGWFGWYAKTENETPARTGRAAPAAPVIVAPVRFDTALDVVEAVGTARALRSVELHPAAAGEVRSVGFSPGQKVAAGDVLLELDSRRAELAVSQARVALKRARELLARYERTGKIGAVSETQVDEARTAVDAARLALAQAQVDLDDRTLEAPFDGHVGFTELDPGDRVGIDTVVATLDDRSALLIDFAVPEAYLGTIEAGRPLTARPWNTESVPMAGVVDAVGTRVDARTRSLPVRARVPNPDGSVLPGLGFRVAIELEGRRLPVIPEAAVVWGGEGSALWKIEDGLAKRVPATIVKRRRGEVLVDAPLAPGELIVIEGVQRLREGLPVQYDTAIGVDGPIGPGASR